MSTWSNMSEDEKESARARYWKVKESGVGTMTVLGQRIAMGPMDLAATRGVSVDECLEQMYEDMPRMLDLAEKIAPLARRLGVKMEFK